MSEFIKTFKDYNPGISIDKWKEMIRNPKIFNEDDLEYIKRICD